MWYRLKPMIKNKGGWRKLIDNKQENPSRVLAFGEHIRELRRTILVCLCLIAVSFLTIFLLVSDQIFAIIFAPIKARHIEIVFVSLSEALMSRIKLSFIVGFILVFPLIIRQLWLFIKPALQPHDVRMVARLLFAMILLFIVGVTFSYLAVFTLTVEFLIQAGQGIAVPKLSIRQYVDFLFQFVIPFGLAFEFPVIALLLVKLRIITHQQMIKVRKYVILFIFILAAFLTPPDVVSQLMLAIPMLLLFEISVVAAKYVKTG
jgi:sec-independent protein translocase protein TatC